MSARASASNFLRENRHKNGISNFRREDGNSQFGLSGDSIKRDSKAIISPFPSIDLAKAFITRPK
jgi:hypothetical protein